MNAIALEEQPKWLQYIWVGLVLMVSMAGIVGSSVALLVFQVTSNDNKGSLSLTHLVYYGGVASTGIYWFVSASLAESSDSWKAFWKRLDSRAGIPWFVSLAAIPVATMIIVNYVPHTLATPPGTVRVMDDGRVFSAGEVVSAPRYTATSRLVPLSRSVPFSIVARTTSGNVAVEGNLQLVLQEGGALKSLLGRDVAALGRQASAQSDAQEQFFAKALVDYLGPKTVQMIQDVQAGKSGARASMLMSLGTRIQSDVAERPGWIQSITITDVDVPSWTLARN